MSVKLLLLKSGEEVITEAKEIIDPASQQPIGFSLHKPFRLDIVSDDGGIVFDSNKGYQVSWFPWAPLSKDKDFFLPAHHVLTAYEPLDTIAEQYVQAIKEENYEENFKRHEERIAGTTSDIDMQKLFDDAEQLLEDDDASSTNIT
tara:strand:+ start:3457 stop:3894 length:438 start_codon:yes stop_codon:yes gene_type:complete